MQVSYVIEMAIYQCPNSLFIFISFLLRYFRVKRHSKTQIGNDGNSLANLYACNGANWILWPKNEITLTNDFEIYWNEEWQKWEAEKEHFLSIKIWMKFPSLCGIFHFTSLFFSFILRWCSKCGTFCVCI